MKLSIKPILFLLLSLDTFFSCVQDKFDESIGDIKMVPITLEADMPEASCATKTGMIDTLDTFYSFWTPDDSVGLYVVCTEEASNKLSPFILSLKNSSTVKSYSASFKGSIPSGYKVKNAWAFYPILKSHKVSSNKTITGIVPTSQNPRFANSFDGNADVLVGPKVSQITELSYKSEFSRLNGFIKVNLYSENSPLADKIKTITLCFTDYVLAGKYSLDLIKQKCLPEQHSSSPITVSYGAEGSASAVLSVFPQPEMNKGTLKIFGSTISGKKFSKEINLTQLRSPISVKANSITQLNVNVTLEENKVPLYDAWDNFMYYENQLDKSERILLDYSYAGYHYGEQLPPKTDVKSISGVTVYNIAEKMAELPQKIKDDAISDARQAFMACVDLHNGGKGKTVFYFPESETPYVLHNNYDNTNGTFTEIDSLGNSKSNPILISRGNFVIIGDGEKSVLKMATENLPDDNKLYSSPEMIIIKSPKGFDDEPTSPPQAIVVSDAVRGSKTVVVNKEVTVGAWYCLYLNKKIDKNKYDDPSVVYDFEGHQAESHMKEIIGSSASTGYLKVREFHKVDKCISVNGKFEVEFHEPIMRDVNIGREGEGNWQLRSFTPIEEIGIENIVFEGRAKTGFWHHNSWKDDGGYKPLQLTRVANSWMRNVTFRSVSECATFATSANCSAYNIKVTGNRGHSGVRAMTSTRIFLGNIVETSEGQFIPAGQRPEGESMPDAGQYHASGVSKPSIGTVLWRNHWGLDATFESHSSQPRATLVDCCKGGWVEWRFGGATEKTPNHLRDLTLWNFEAERIYLRNGQQGNYYFWDNEAINRREGGGPNNGGEYWRVAPPIVVGFRGNSPLVFNTTLSGIDPKKGQLKYYEENFNDVDRISTGSLYEAQLRQRVKRDGISDLWLRELEEIKKSIP